MERLPIWQAADAIRGQLSAVGRVVLAAPTGSGKTTQVPQMLVSWAGPNGGRVLVVEPRRLAARMMARRVAQEMGVALGKGVGFTTRHERQSGPADRIEFVTDGVFLQRLGRDPELKGVAAVVLDEFHERRLAVDLALSLVMRLQTRRSELALVVMSATADTERIAEFSDASVVSVSGRAYPVELEYQGESSSSIWDQAAQAVARLCRTKAEGDVLVFMPGSYEIVRTMERLKALSLPGNPLILALTARTGMEDQEQCFAQTSRRKIIVSTNVAETSVTLPGVRFVVDSGLARVLRFDARRGIERLRVESISQASATQRAGRAGRVGPGLCVRLWSQAEERGRSAHETPEVLRVDLTEWILRLAGMGLRPQQVAWLDSPEPHALEYGFQTLQAIGALDAAGELTDLGRLLSTGHVHPRLCRALLEVCDADLERVAGWCAVLSEEIGWRLSPAEWALKLGVEEGNDIDVLWNAVMGRGGVVEGEGVLPGAAQVRRTATELVGWRRGLDLGNPKKASRPWGNAEATSAMVAGFPDKIGAVRADGSDRVSWAGGVTARLHKGSTCRGAGPFLALDVEEREAGKSADANQERWVRWAMPLDEATLRRTHPHLFREEVEYTYLDDRDIVERVHQLWFGDVLLRSRNERGGPGAGPILASLIQEGRVHLEAWDEDAEPWMARVRCVGQWFPERKLIAYDNDEIRLVLLEFCEGATRVAHLRDRSLLAAMKNVLSQDDVRFVERMAPLRLDLPGGHKMKLRYSLQEPPTGRARIQDLYGVEQTPRVGGGRIAVRVEILAPNNRPVQVTEDLAGFWRTLYPEIRKALSRRYPRHEWR